MIDEGTSRGVEDVLIGMAHRGRLNVLSNVIRKPMEMVFKEFRGTAHVMEDEVDGEEDDWSSSGDVKYHLGTSFDRAYPDGRRVSIALLPNPSHLEVTVGAASYVSSDTDSAAARREGRSARRRRASRRRASRRRASETAAKRVQSGRWDESSSMVSSSSSSVSASGPRSPTLKRDRLVIRCDPVPLSPTCHIHTNACRHTAAGRDTDANRRRGGATRAPRRRRARSLARSPSPSRARRRRRDVVAQAVNPLVVGKCRAKMDLKVA